MNLFIMDAESILIHYKPKTEEETHIIDAMKWLYEELNDIKDVLSDYSLSYDHTGFLNKELQDLADNKDELLSLQNVLENRGLPTGVTELELKLSAQELDFDCLQDENEELKHEISYLKGDLDQLKKDF